MAFLTFNLNGLISELMLHLALAENRASFLAIGFVSREKIECLSCNLMIVVLKSIGFDDAEMICYQSLICSAPSINLDDSLTRPVSM